MHKIALTGATGFIGRNLAEMLVRSGCSVNALTRQAFPPDISISRKITWIQGDLQDLQGLERLVRGVDTVIHCAGAVRGRTVEEFCRVNQEGTRQLAEICRQCPTPPRFILISSLAAREPGLSPYASSKKLGEDALCSTYSGNSWFILRPPAVYGPGDRELMPLFRCMARGFCPIIGDGNQKVSLVHVTDLAEAIKVAALTKDVSGGIYEIHDGKNGGYSWHEIIGTVSEVTGKERILKIRVPKTVVNLIGFTNIYLSRLTGRAPMLTPGKVNELVHPDWTANNDKITRALGWMPKITLEKGLSSLLNRSNE